MSGNALPEDYEEMWERERLAALEKEIKCACVCGEVRVFKVPVDNEDTAQVTPYPCKCGRFMCVVGKTTAPDTLLDNLLDIT
jgi:hypothetical protein